MDPFLRGGGGGRELCRMRNKIIQGSVRGVTDERGNHGLEGRRLRRLGRLG